MVNSTNSKREPKSKTINLVRNWLPVPKSTRFSRMDKGYASSNWIFSYNNSRYILKRFMALGALSGNAKPGILPLVLQNA